MKGSVSMAYDGITMHFVKKELENCLIGGKIHKIYQPNKNEILLGVYANGKHYALTIHISSDCYHMNLTTSKKENPMKAPNFCMLLRKYIMGAVLKDITGYGLERIVTFHLEGYNELNDKITRYLIVELMGKHSNILLTNEHFRIIDSLRHLDITEGSTRDILPAREYVLPSNTKQEFLEISFDTFYAHISSCCQASSIANAISSSYIGFSLSFVQHLLNQLSITEWNPTTAKTIFSTLQNMLTYKTPITPKLTTSDYTILPSAIPEEPLAMNFFLDDFYTQKEQQTAFTTYRNHILKLVWNTLQKENHILETMEQKLQDCTQMDTYRLYGELLTSNLYRLPHEHVDSITVENYYAQNQPITIPLLEKLSPADNAKQYYKKYRKMKHALEIVSNQKKEVLQEIQYLESIVYEIENCKTLEEMDTIYMEISENVLSKKAKTSSSDVHKNKRNPKKHISTKSSYLSYTVGSYTVLVGKNNVQNDELTCKIAHAKDIWFHTKEIHGSHCILQLPAGSPPPTQDILYTCACIAAYYSKGKHSSSVPVDYCPVKYVHKPNGAKPGMVIYKNNKTLYATPQLPECSKP